MNYLFLILVCYAVKCEDVGNKYFVFKMPEDIKEFKKPFQVYWNVPTMQCASKKIPFQNLFEKFGIIQNDNDSFIGNKIVVIYDEKDFPAVINNKGTGKNILRNGGVPQEGNLENHLIAFENDLNFKIPDPYFEGIAIIDFESWRPVFRQNFGALIPHKHLSIEIEKQLHNWWPKMWIEREASLRFETAARRFMQTTLSMAKKMRPNALWGYYGFPHCFNMRGKDMAEKCANNVDKENDSIYWLWAESTALFPSLYSSVSLTSSQLSLLIKGRVKEASRVRGIDTPIFPYFWYRYIDAGFMTEKNLEAAFNTLYESDASGFIIWGSSNDVNTIDKCNKLYKYVETVLGPKIAKYTKRMKSIHSDPLENKKIYSKETSTVYDGFSHSQNTKSLNTDKMFSTETTTVNNKYTETDESSYTLRNDEISSTESNIKYNDYTNSDDLQTLNNFDLSLLETSTNSEYMNINLSIPILNNEETLTTESTVAYDEHTYKNTLNNDEVFSFSAETSTEYINTDQSSPTYNNDEISFSEETKIFYNEYSNSEENVLTLNNDDIISSSESFTFGYENCDHSKRTSNNDEVSLDNISTENLVDIIDNDNLISSSESSIFDYENSDSTTILNNDEISLENISTENFVDTIDNDKLISLSKSSIFDYENSDGTTILSNEKISLENISTENFVDTIYNDNFISSSKLSIFDYKNSDSTTTLSNDEISSAKMSTIDNSDRYESSQTLNYEKTTIINNEYFDTVENVQNLNNNHRISSSQSSILFNENSDNSTNTLNEEDVSTINTIIPYSKFINSGPKNISSNNKEIFSKETSIIYDDFVNEDQSTDSLNTVKNIKEKIKTENNVLKSTENFFLNNNMLFDSNEDRFDYLIEVDKTTNVEKLEQSKYKNSINVDDDYLIILKENLTDSKLETIYETTQADNDYETVTNSKKFRQTPNDLVVTYMDKKYGVTKNEDSTSAKVESLQNIALLNFDNDRSDYLIKVDNSTNIVTYNQSDCIHNVNADDDDLIIVTDFNNKKYEKNNILDSNLNLDLYSTTQTEPDPVSDTKFEDFGVTAKDLDLIVAYVNKTIDNMKFQDLNEDIPTENEPLDSIKLLNSNDNVFEYLIQPDKFKNKETAKQNNYTKSSADKDNIIIIKNLDD